MIPKLTDSELREFFRKRFHREPENDKTYFEEWEYRNRFWSNETFQRGADEETQAVYQHVIGERIRK